MNIHKLRKLLPRKRMKEFKKKGLRVHEVAHIIGCQSYNIQYLEKEMNIYLTRDKAARKNMTLAMAESLYYDQFSTEITDIAKGAWLSYVTPVNHELGITQ